MQYAVITTGGKQYLAVPGQELIVESLSAEEGSTITFDQVLLNVDGKKVEVGTPSVGNLSVTATVVSQRLGEKLDILKYRGKSRYRRHMGHRQHQTVIRIETIGGLAAKTESKKAEVAKEVSVEATTAKPRAKKVVTKE